MHCEVILPLQKEGNQNDDLFLCVFIIFYIVQSATLLVHKLAGWFEMRKSGI